MYSSINRNSTDKFENEGENHTLVDITIKFNEIRGIYVWLIKSTNDFQETKCVVRERIKCSSRCREKWRLDVQH